MSKKKVLITNDDGLNGEGLCVLAEKLSEVCDVYVIAPDSNRSGVSSMITMHVPLVFSKKGENVFACSGSPVDCVIAAVKSSIFDVKFDAVFSGINRGPNMGTDLIYSGTAAAARQAALYKIPGIAVSLASDGEDCNEGFFNYEPLARFCAKNLDRLISLCSDNLFVSVNACSSDEYKGAVPSSLCIRSYGDRVRIEDCGGGTLKGIFEGGNITATGKEDCDFFVTKKNKISVTLLYAEPVCREFDCSIDFDL